MSETDTDTTLCTDCQVPIPTPKPTFSHGGSLAFVPASLCKDCLRKVREAWEAEEYRRRRLCNCPYKPDWRLKT